jgi:hypothetical protein
MAHQQAQKALTRSITSQRNASIVEQDKAKKAALDAELRAIAQSDMRHQRTHALQQRQKQNQEKVDRDAFGKYKQQEVAEEKDEFKDYVRSVLDEPWMQGNRWVKPVDVYVAKAYGRSSSK